MCDKENLARFDRMGLNRRQFGALGAAGAMGVMLPACTTMRPGEGGLAERSVTIPTADGTMDAFLVHPGQGQHPAVLMWPDIAGLREAFRMMARRTAADGYAVLVANPFYRDLPAPQFADFGEFRSGNGFERVGPWRDRLTSAAIGRDAAAAVTWLDAQEAVDNSRGIGTEGYCMSGPFTVWSAAAVSSRIRAAASFHGGGLVRDSEDSPHRLLGQTQARFLFAIAQDDDAENPEAKTTLAQAAQAADRQAEIEVYSADHGWTVIDSPAYDRDAAERAYGRKIALYSKL